MMNCLLLLIVLTTTTTYAYGSPLKRCANLFDEGCINDGVIGGGRDEEWVTGGDNPGKRNIHFQHAPKPLRYRCANLFDESCDSQGIVNGGKNEEWITDPESTPGKRNIYRKQQNERDALYKALEEFLHRRLVMPSKRCANLFDEGCSNGGLPGSGKDDDWLNNGDTPGRR